LEKRTAVGSHDQCIYWTSVPLARRKRYVFQNFSEKLEWACGIDRLAEMAPRQEWFHKLLAPAIVLLFFLYIALLFARL
jgi:hypothetical protein